MYGYLYSKAIVLNVFSGDGDGSRHPMDLMERLRARGNHLRSWDNTTKALRMSITVSIYIFKILSFLIVLT